MDLAEASGDRYVGYEFPVREVFEVQGDVPQIRVDGFWGDIKAARFCPAVSDSEFATSGMGCGSIPKSLSVKPESRIEILHYGYADPRDRVAKHARYTGTAGHNAKHIASILKQPSLRDYKHKHP